MDLADNIQSLRDRTQADLNSAHDYYIDTQTAWSLVQAIIAAGQTFSNQNRGTGTITSQVDLAAKSEGYIAIQLAEATFQQFLSIFENFYFDLVRLWLTAYPESLGTVLSET